MRRRNEIVAVNAQVAHARPRQVQLQRLPPRAGVERDVHADLGARVQQPAPNGILADAARVRAGRDSRDDRGPGLSVVRRLPEIRPEVVLLIAIGRDVRGAGVEARRLDHRRARELSIRPRRDVLPVAAPVTRDVKQSVIGSRPEQPFRDRRLVEGIDRRVPLGARHVSMNGTTGAPQRGGIVNREVRGDRFPARTLVGRAMHVLRRHVQRLGIVRRDEHRERPLETIRNVGRGPTVVVRHPHRDVPLLTRGAIHSAQETGVTTAVGHVRVARVHGDRGVLAAGDGEVVALADRAVVGAARDRDRRVVLLRAENAIRPLIVGGDVIELRGGLVVDARPSLAMVIGDGGAAIVAVYETSGVLRVHPHDVGVAVRNADAREVPPAVHRAPHAQVHHVHGVLVRRVGGHRGVVPGAHRPFLVPARQLPRVAAVVRAEDSPGGIGRLDARVDALRVCGGDRDADLAERLPRDPGIEADLLPAVAAVRGLPQAAAAAAGVHAPRRALKLPHRREEDARVRGIDGEVHRARRVVEKQHSLPRLPTVGGAKDAAFRIGTKRVSDRRDENTIVIARIDDDVADLLRVVEAEVLPAATAVGGAIDAGAVREVLAQLRFAGADVDDVRIRRRHGNRAHGGDVGLAVGHVAPGLPAVRRLPDAAVHRAEVEDQRPGWIPSHGVHASASEGPHESPLERLEPRRRSRRIRVDAGVIRGIQDGGGRRPLRGTRIALSFDRAREREGCRQREKDPDRCTTRNAE